MDIFVGELFYKRQRQIGIRESGPVWSLCFENVLRFRCCAFDIVCTSRNEIQVSCFSAQTTSCDFGWNLFQRTRDSLSWLLLNYLFGSKINNGSCLFEKIKFDASIGFWMCIHPSDCSALILPVASIWPSVSSFLALKVGRIWLFRFRCEDVFSIYLIFELWHLTQIWRRFG